MYFAKEYDARNLQGLQDFSRKQLLDYDAQKHRAKIKDPNAIEQTGEQMLTKNVANHGISFLWDFMKPSVSSMENRIGIFNGNAMPVSVKGSGNYKRGIAWLLKAKSGAFNAELKHSIDLTNLDRAVKAVAEIDFVWRRYFAKQDKHIPLDAMEVNRMASYGIPKWNYKLNSLFANYTDIKINKDVNEFNPFGMGSKYDANLAFFRALSNIGNRNAGGFDEGAKILSYTHQLQAENGYVNPWKHLSLMGEASKKMGSVMDQVFPAQVDINTGAAVPLRPFDIINNPIHVLLGGGHLNGPGVSMDPYKQMNHFERRSIKKMINQVKDMKVGLFITEK